MQSLQARYKTLVAGLGSVLTYLYTVQATNPNKYVSLAILVLTVLGVHQVKNGGVAPEAPSTPAVVKPSEILDAPKG